MTCPCSLVRLVVALTTHTKIVAFTCFTTPSNPNPAVMREDRIHQIFLAFIHSNEEETAVGNHKDITFGLYHGICHLRATLKLPSHCPTFWSDMERTVSGPNCQPMLKTQSCMHKEDQHNARSKICMCRSEVWLIFEEKREHSLEAQQSKPQECGGCMCASQDRLASHDLCKQSSRSSNSKEEKHEAHELWMLLCGQLEHFLISFWVSQLPSKVASVSSDCQKDNGHVSWMTPVHEPIRQSKRVEGVSRWLQSTLNAVG